MAYLDAAAAETRLKNLTQWTSAPGLSQAEITDLLLSARAPDRQGRMPDYGAYTVSYTEASVRRAASEGWLMKAGKLVDQFDAAVGMGTSFQRSQQRAACLEQARKLSSSIGSVGVVR